MREHNECIGITGLSIKEGHNKPQQQQSQMLQENTPLAPEKHQDRSMLHDNMVDNAPTGSEVPFIVNPTLNNVYFVNVWANTIYDGKYIIICYSRNFTTFDSNYNVLKCVH